MTATTPLPTTGLLAALGRAGRGRRHTLRADAGPSARRDARPHISFASGGETYALPTSVAREVVSPPPITPLPHVPAFVLGVVNLRGALVPVLDLRARLGHAPAARTAETSIVIVDVGGLTGLLVDRLVEVFDVAPGETLPLPPLGDGQGAALGAVTGIVPRPGGAALVLDAGRLLGDGVAFRSRGE